MAEDLKIIGEVINTDDVFIAEVEDSSDAFTPGAMKRLAPTASIARDTTTNTKSRYYSGKAYFTDSAEGETKVTLVIPGLSVKTRAYILGKIYDTTSGKVFDAGEAEAPYLALSYKLHRPDGIVECACYPKGKFSIPKQEGATKTDSVDEKNLTLEYTAVSTQHLFQLAPDVQKGVKIVEADTSEAAFTKAMADAWNNTVQLPPEIASGGGE